MADGPPPVRRVGLELLVQLPDTRSSPSNEGLAYPVERRFESVLRLSSGREIEALRGVAQFPAGSVVRHLRSATRECGEEEDSYRPRCSSSRNLRARSFALGTSGARQKRLPPAIPRSLSGADPLGLQVPERFSAHPQTGWTDALAGDRCS